MAYPLWHWLYGKGYAMEGVLSLGPLPLPLDCFMSSSHATVHSLSTFSPPTLVSVPHLPNSHLTFQSHLPWGLPGSALFCVRTMLPQGLQSLAPCLAQKYLIVSEFDSGLRVLTRKTAWCKIILTLAAIKFKKNKPSAALFSISLYFVQVKMVEHGFLILKAKVGMSDMESPLNRQMWWWVCLLMIL